ncbi:TauD/TfdA family dioxygenase [Balneatrix alpica]|uniref:TauD/TfdA family dioxygenase n=1 Tax=Balneatrix alpica TaxID=75684 RepID=A0ABV5Z7D4_9GAMM|nr:TauD/TfdA family dioxygenase [Balneatrix alpica]
MQTWGEFVPQAAPGHLAIGQGFPALVVCPAQVITVQQACAWVEQHQQAIRSSLAEVGVLLFRGFPLHSAEDFDAFSAAFNYRSFTYQESLSNAVRINFTPRVFSANEAPPEVEIFLHHEMAQTPLAPEKLFFFCLQPADVGGATPVCRSDALYQRLLELVPEFMQDCEQKGLKYRTRMPGENDQQSGQGRSWRSTLNCQTQAEAEAKLVQLGYSWQWLEDGSLEARTPVLPAVIEHESGRKVFFNQLIAAYMGWAGVRDHPAKALSFGDDSAIAAEHLQLAASLAAEFTYPLAWQAGDMALVDNRLAMHGRYPYQGQTKRQVLVALGRDPY